MKKIVVLTLMSMSFFTSVFAAEKPQTSPFVTRGKSLGDTGDRLSLPPKQVSLIKIALPASVKPGKPRYLSPRDSHQLSVLRPQDQVKFDDSSK